VIYLHRYRWHHRDLGVRLRRTKPPTEQPMDLATVVAHLRLEPGAETGPEQATLERMLAAATGHFERYCACAVMRQEWTMTMRAFPPYRASLVLPYPPLVDVASIDVDGDAQDIADYALELDDRMPGAVHPTSGQWPLMTDLSAAEVVFECGRDQADVPEDMRQAILMAIASWYENRESLTQFVLTPMIELGWESLCGHYREAGFA
jgi:uncharacterized phiE125 gp8 family phage protein